MKRDELARALSNLKTEELRTHQEILADVRRFADTMKPWMQDLAEQIPGARFDVTEGTARSAHSSQLKVPVLRLEFQLGAGAKFTLAIGPTDVDRYGVFTVMATGRDGDEQPIRFLRRVDTDTWCAVQSPDGPSDRYRHLAPLTEELFYEALAVGLDL